MSCKILPFLFCLVCSASAQYRNTPEAIRYLLQYPKAIPVISGYFKGLLPENELTPELRMQDQYLVKTTDHLYCGINGTGRLYELSDRNRKLYAKRIDSTFFYGHNFYAAVFTLNNEIFSYGGYGFWKTNGLLRKYNPYTRDWFVQKTNVEIPVTVLRGFSFFWVDEHHNLLYVGRPVFENQGLSGDSTPRKVMEPKLYVLNINSGVWRALGALTKEVNPEYMFLAESGTLNPLPVDNSLSQLYDFRNNMIFESTGRIHAELQKTIREIQNDIFFSIDTTVYFAAFKTNYFDSIPVSLSDFRMSGKQIYTPPTTASKPLRAWTSYGWVLLPLLFGAYWIWSRRDAPKKNNLPEAPEMPVASPPPMEHPQDTIQAPVAAPRKIPFNSIEKGLIRLLLRENVNQQSLSVEDLNRYLGLSEKNEAVQKKNRNNVINDINKKWAVFIQEESLLIERHRSEMDKRAFEYFIQPKWVSAATELLQES